MSKPSKLKLPPPEEWNFTGVKPDDLAHATYYEYARSCPWIKSQWQAWHESSIPEWQEVAGLEFPVWHPKKTIKVWNAIAQHYPQGIRVNSWERDEIENRLMKSFPPALSDVGLEPLLLSVTDFPKPYQSLDKEQRKRLFAIPVNFETTEPPRPAFRDAIAPPKFEGCEYVFVDWHRKPEEIRRDFKKWLDKKLRARTAPKVKTKPQVTGRAAEKHFAYLTWLATYRIDEAGIPFRDAQELLESEIERTVRRDEWQPPVYPHQPNWSENIRLAKRLMEQLFGNRQQSGIFRRTDLIPRPVCLPKSGK